MPNISAKVDYKNVIELSHEFFEAQRSGWVEDDTQISWKRDSGLYDGGVEGVDLIGGYYTSKDFDYSYIHNVYNFNTIMQVVFKNIMSFHIHIRIYLPFCILFTLCKLVLS